MQTTINFLIKKYNLKYSLEEMKGLIKELEIRDDEISLEVILSCAGEKRSQLKFCLLYHDLFNFIQSPSEQIMSILVEAKTALEEINKIQLAKSIEWVMLKIKNEEIYEINYDTSSEKSPLRKNTLEGDIENKKKIFNEFSWDVFDQTKKANLIADKKITARKEGLFSKILASITGNQFFLLFFRVLLELQKLTERLLWLLTERKLTESNLIKESRL